MAGPFDKTNPHATLKSVLFWAVVTPLWTTPLFFWLHPFIRENWTVAVPALIVFSALLGALGEW